MKKTQLELSNKNQKIVFKKQKSGFGFSLLVKKGHEWQSVGAGNNPLIWGPSFNLRPQSIKKENSKSLFLKGENPAYLWQARVTLLSSDWFKFRVELELPTPLRLRQESEGEPQILFKLPSVSVQEEGGFIWDQILIANPSVDSAGVQSSDLPSAYYFDPRTQNETMVFLDWGSFNWASNKNIFGFLGGKCGLKSILKKEHDQPIRERFLGFWPENTSYLGDSFPKGKQVFQFYLRARFRKHQPCQWQALSRLVSALAPLLETGKTEIEKKYSWKIFTKKCLSELTTEKKIAQVKFKNRALGLRAYGQIGDFSSPNPSSRVELMTQVDLIWPLIFYLRLDSDKETKSFFDCLYRLLPRFFDPENQFLANWYPHANDLLPQDQETWYFLENGLIKFGWIALLTKSEKLKNIFLQFSERLIGIAQENCYLFPLRYHWKKNKNTGERKNFIAGGLYGYGMCLAFKLTGEKTFLKEAEKALKTIYQLPLEFLFHEPQQLGFAAAAAFTLFRETGKKKWKKLAKNLLSQQLRMFYWYTDQELLSSIGCDCAGMVRSFPSKIYPVIKQNPAFKENVESILPWTLLLKDKEFVSPLLKFLDLVRKNNFYFFDCFQKNEENSFIPLEALPALSETGSKHRGGGIGHAVYGAGEVIWLYLLFEALAEASDKEIMVICLDYLDTNRPDDFTKEQNFIVYNPTKEKKDFKLILKKTGRENPKKIDLTLNSQEHRYVKIKTFQKKGGDKWPNLK